MFVIGPHISIAKGFTKAAQTAVDIGANTFQFFSRNPRGGNAKEYDEKDIKKFQQIRKDNNLSQEQLAEKLNVSRQSVSKW